MIPDPAKVRALWAEFASIDAQVKSKGWPEYCQNPEQCMERAYEYLDRVDAVLEREGIRYEDWRQGAIQEAEAGSNEKRRG